MHLLFLDESGRLEQDGIFGLGGIAVRDTGWHRLRDVWQDTLRTHGWPLDLELKWHGIRAGKVPPAIASVHSRVKRFPDTVAPERQKHRLF
jgi:hypothetical protein